MIGQKRDKIFYVTLLNYGSFGDFIQSIEAKLVMWQKVILILIIVLGLIAMLYCIINELILGNPIEGQTGFIICIILTVFVLTLSIFALILVADGAYLYLNVDNARHQIHYFNTKVFPEVQYQMELLEKSRETATIRNATCAGIIAVSFAYMLCSAVWWAGREY